VIFDKGLFGFRFKIGSHGSKEERKKEGLKKEEKEDSREDVSGLELEETEEGIE